jgi:hypothetical protein
LTVAEEPQEHRGRTDRRQRLRILTRLVEDAGLSLVHAGLPVQVHLHGVELVHHATSPTSAASVLPTVSSLASTESRSSPVDGTMWGLANLATVAWASSATVAEGAAAGPVVAST